MMKLGVDDLIRIGNTIHSGDIVYYQEEDDDGKYLVVEGLEVQGFARTVHLSYDGLDVTDQERIRKDLKEYLEE